MKPLNELLSFDISEEYKNLQVNGISDDSRSIKQGDMFIAVNGAVADGSKYIDDAVVRGAKFVVQQASNNEVQIENGIVKIYVPNVRVELAHIASHFFDSEFRSIVGVTGTNGKSSTVDIVRQIWNCAGRNGASIGTLGIITRTKHELLSRNLTSPGAIELHKILQGLSLSSIDSVAIEASSHGIEQRRLDDVKFDVCAFTNLTQDHLDYHKTLENYWLAKLRLFSKLADKHSVFVVNADSEYSADIYDIAQNKKIRCINYGYNADDFKIVSVNTYATYQEIEACIHGQEYSFRLPLQGTFQVYNFLCAAAICYATGVDIDSCVQAIENLTPINGRLELVAQYNSANIYIDYAHTPDALQNALLSLRQHTSRKLLVVFGCGGNRDQQKRTIMGDIAQRYADSIIVTDDNPRDEEAAGIRKMILKGCPNAMDIGDREEAISYAVKQLGAGDTLLVAGKGHEDYQIIGTNKIHFSDREVILMKVQK